MAPKAQILIRLPADLKSRLKEQAIANNRTTNGEIIDILTRALTADHGELE